MTAERRERAGELESRILAVPDRDETPGRRQRQPRLAVGLGQIGELAEQRRVELGCLRAFEPGDDLVGPPGRGGEKRPGGIDRRRALALAVAHDLDPSPSVFRLSQADHRVGDVERDRLFPAEAIEHRRKLAAGRLDAVEIGEDQDQPEDLVSGKVGRVGERLLGRRQCAFRVADGLEHGGREHRPALQELRRGHHPFRDLARLVRRRHADERRKLPIGKPERRAPDRDLQRERDQVALEREIDQVVVELRRERTCQIGRPQPLEGLVAPADTELQPDALGEQCGSFRNPRLEAIEDGERGAFQAGTEKLADDTDQRDRGLGLGDPAFGQLHRLGLAPRARQDTDVEFDRALVARHLEAVAELVESGLCGIEVAEVGLELGEIHPVFVSRPDLDQAAQDHDLLVGFAVVAVVVRKLAQDLFRRADAREIGERLQIVVDARRLPIEVRQFLLRLGLLRMGDDEALHQLDRALELADLKVDPGERDDDADGQVAGSEALLKGVLGRIVVEALQVHQGELAVARDHRDAGGDARGDEKRQDDVRRAHTLRRP